MLTKHPLLIITAISAISAISFSACVPLAPTEPGQTDEEHSSEESMMEDGEWTEEEMAEMEMMEKDEETDEISTDEGTKTEKPAEYTAYSEAKYNELKGKQGFAIFFHANWCPTCISMEKAIKADLSNYPNGANILVADFDTESALKLEYGIQMQSTIVIVDSDGNPVKTLAAPSSAEVKQELEAVL